MCATTVTAELGARQQRRQRRTEVDISSGKDKFSESAAGWSTWVYPPHFISSHQSQVHLFSQTPLPS
ncbi:hypothetical protein HYQ44_008998 [Verticillium longisporum]|nr:hypothetical protein HYQ44_008998 [Verticillium longisporum]